MNCIFITLFVYDKHIKLLYSFLESLYITSNLKNIKILIYSSNRFINIIKKSKYYNDNIIFESNNNISEQITKDSIRKKDLAKLDYFTFKNLNFDKILYCNVENILITSDVSKIFELCEDNILYSLDEYTDVDNTSFNTNVLLFKNCDVIKQLFNSIKDDIHIRPKEDLQYYIIFNAFKNNLYNNTVLQDYLFTMNDNDILPSDKTIFQFPNDKHKIDKINIVLNTVSKIHITDYKKFINCHKDKLKGLYNICKKIGKKVEENCFTGLNIDNPMEQLIFKQMNHYSLAKNAKNIIEIGFNAGHSCLLFLLANNESHITVFDICEHKYTMPCFEYLQSLFPNRLTLYEGDSVETVPLFYENNIDNKFDLIHIDGDRYYNTPKTDFDNIYKLASNIIILDSTNDAKINDVFNEYVNNKKVYEIFLYDTFMYEHRICKVMDNV